MKKLFVLLSVLTLLSACAGAPVELVEKGNKGDAAAQYQLGFIYLHGKDVSPDTAKAAEWYAKSAMQGHADAQYMLGTLYENGNGVAQSYEKALEWYTKAGMQGNPNAFAGISTLYYNGYGVKKDILKAHMYLIVAKELGFLISQDYFEAKKRLFKPEMLEQTQKEAKELLAQVKKP